MKTCSPMPLAIWQGPHTMSLAGVAAKISPCFVGRSAGDSTSTMGEVPDLAMEPMAFSTILASPPFLFPGVGLALRSTWASSRYLSYQRISAASLSRTSSLTQRSAMKCTPSRTSVTSLKSTVPPP